MTPCWPFPRTSSAMDTSHIGIEHRERKAKVRVPEEVVIMDQTIRVRPGAVLRDSTRAAEDGEKLYCTLPSHFRMPSPSGSACLKQA